MTDNSVEVEIVEMELRWTQRTKEEHIRIIAMAPIDCNLHIGKAIIEQEEE